MVLLAKSTKPVKEKEINRKWKLIDIKGKVLGRTITKIAIMLQGKDKVNYVDYLDMGDYVVVVNAAEAILTGNKADTKEYDRYSGYPGGRRKTVFKKAIVDNPQQVIRHAVSGMLPKNKHRDVRLARLFIYKDDKHPYSEKINKNEEK